jgi:hypothetical protein
MWRTARMGMNGVRWLLGRAIFCDPVILCDPVMEVKNEHIASGFPITKFG